MWISWYIMQGAIHQECKATLSNSDALMIAHTAFGGALYIKGSVFFLAFIITVSICMAYYNVKRLQIDQYRAWMLGAMFYLGTIITVRLIFLMAGHVVGDVGSYYQIRSCEEVAFLSPKLAQKYPGCRNATGNLRILVKADFAGKGGPEQIGAAIDLSFGMPFWYSIVMHMIGVEIYLNLTPAETQRLRTVSYERQLEAGLKNPGNAGETRQLSNQPHQSRQSRQPRRRSSREQFFFEHEECRSEEWDI